MPSPTQSNQIQAQAGEPTPKKIRIEYEVPPMRAIWSDWFEEQPEATDDEIRAVYTAQFPTHRIRKIERNIGLTEAITRQHHEE